MDIPHICSTRKYIIFFLPSSDHCNKNKHIIYIYRFGFSDCVSERTCRREGRGRHLQLPSITPVAVEDDPSSCLARKQNQKHNEKPKTHKSNENSGKHQKNKKCKKKNEKKIRRNPTYKLVFRHINWFSDGIRRNPAAVFRGSRPISTKNTRNVQIATYQ